MTPRSVHHSEREQKNKATYVTTNKPSIYSICLQILQTTTPSMQAVGTSRGMVLATVGEPQFGDPCSVNK